MIYRFGISIFVLFSIISTGMILYTKTLQENVVVNSGLENAKIYADGIAAFRTLYTSEVVSVATAHGLEVTHDYHGKKAIPLPATLSILLGDKIKESGSGESVRLYSPYPFPWRKKTGGLSDMFSEKAWQAFLKDASKPYFEFSFDKKASTLRYAVADTMRASCVNCHNTHPESPKTDWREGDIRGILEVKLPLDNVMTKTDTALNITILIYTLLSILGILGIFSLVRKHRQEASVLMATNNELKTALGEIETLRGIIPICSYCHSIRNDDGAWDKMEAYLSKHSEAIFSHGICPNCLAKARADAELGTDER